MAGREEAGDRGQEERGQEGRRAGYEKGMRAGWQGEKGMWVGGKEEV